MQNIFENKVGKSVAFVPYFNVFNCC